MTRVRAAVFGVLVCLLMCVPTVASAQNIAGTVTSSATNLPQPGILVFVFNDTGGFASAAFTDASGNYASGIVAPGTYYVRTSGAVGLIDQLYSGIPCPVGCVVT